MKLFENSFRDNEKPWIFYERYIENGESYIKRIPLQQECFIPDPHGDYTLLTDSSKKLRKTNYNKNLEGEHEIYGKTDVGLEWIRKTYWSPKGSSYNTRPRVWCLDIETTAHAPVNTDLCNEKIVSIQIYDNLLNINFIFALEDFDIESHTSENGNYIFDGREYNFKLKYFKFSEESELLEAYFKLTARLKPLIILAHNGSGFDFAYLWKRTLRLGLEPCFSPFGKSKQEIRELDNGNKFYNIIAPGIIFMDSLDIYKKFTFTPRASYSLDFLCEAELGERKVNHDCYKTFDGFRTGLGYVKPSIEPSKDSILEYKLFHSKSDEEVIKISKEYFIHYSIIDTFLLFNLINKLKLIDVMIDVASTTGCLIEHTLGTIKPWETYIRNISFQENKILPNKPESDIDTNFKGGFVKDPERGKYGWSFSVDVTSMYPSQIMAFNMSAETYIPHNKLPEELRKALDEVMPSEDEQYHLDEYKNNPGKYNKLTELLNKYNIACSLVGTCFSKEKKGIIPILIDDVFKKRKEAKKIMLSKEQELELIKAELSKRGI